MAHIRLFLEVYSQLYKVQVVDVVSDVTLGKVRSYEPGLAVFRIDGTFCASRCSEKIKLVSFAGLRFVVLYTIPLCCVVPCRRVLVLCFNLLCCAVLCLSCVGS